jgi:hypothetical protein
MKDGRQTPRRGLPKGRGVEWSSKIPAIIGGGR